MLEHRQKPTPKLREFEYQLPPCICAHISTYLDATQCSLRVLIVILRLVHVFS